MLVLFINEMAEIYSNPMLASSPGRQFKFRKKDGLVAIATMLVRMRWPLRENT